MASEALARVAELDARRIADAAALRGELVEPCRPTVLRGLVAAWPVVAAGRRSPAASADYLARFARPTPIEAFVGDPAIKGRYFYGDRAGGFNFDRRTLPFADAVRAIAGTADDPDAPTLYSGSTPVDAYLPGFRGENALPFLPQVEPRIWIGHTSVVTAHYDTSDNIACVAAGRRRFTLYAPQLTGDLYVGPIDHTMAGQPVSLAASADAATGTFPRFDAIRDEALVAELEPGDALYIPKLWWHQVEGLARFNILVNYWWDATAQGPDEPYTALMLAMIAIAERPPGERANWEAFFRHYVFRPDGHPLAHLPPERHGILGPVAENYGRVRAWIMRTLRGG